MAEFFRRLEDDCNAQYDTLPLNDNISRDRVMLYLSMLRRFKLHLEQTLSEGQYADKRLSEWLELEKKGRSPWHSRT